MNYAGVAVNSPGSRSIFCYAIPPGLSINVGQAVWVPFGSRIVQGIVLQLSDEPAVEETKEIAGVITDFPQLSPIQMKLAQWISEYYFAPPFDAISLMLPPGFERRAITCFQLTALDLVESQADLPLTPEQRQVLNIMRGKMKTSLPELEKAIGRRKARQITDQLLDRQLITQTLELEPARIKPKTVPYIKLVADREEIEAAKVRLDKSRAHKQAELLESLTGQTQPISISELRKRLRCSPATIKALESHRLVSVERLRVRRDPLAHLSFTPSPPPVPTSSQQAAWESMEDVIVNGVGQPDRPARRTAMAGGPPVFLLFGVTGSGKTEIYLRALAQVVAAGKKGICLIPEIALTQQTVERFANRFSGRVAVLHSGLSLGEQFDEWQWIAEGNCHVIIGPRSALFAPLPDLGLIIVDEEHEWTYKQEDKSPRYHARDVAIKLAHLSGAVVILGSATPDIGSFHKAQQGEYQLVELKERITPRGYSPLPEVTVVDLREELKAGNTSLFSRSLLAAMKGALVQGEQIILFLNRRGTATFVRCRSCGFVFRCPRCSVALTYHSVERKLICHRCRYSIPVPQSCSRCSRHNLRFLGIGTQRIEDEVRHFFPEARLLRWDRDVITGRYAHEELLKNFRDHKADVLIGTQMIAKGLDLPQVTLAGVINADTGLNFPDFRSGERTFQLLCQVAGRAGRGLKAGKVIIQTYSPDNYIIEAAAKHDYFGFYYKEIDYRRRYNYPPFSQLVRLVHSHTDERLCHREAERVYRLIADSRELTADSIIGPVPAFAFRARGRYRWQLFLRGPDSSRILSQLTLPRGWTIDVDPVGMV